MPPIGYTLHDCLVPGILVAAARSVSSRPFVDDAELERQAFSERAARLRRHLLRPSPKQIQLIEMNTNFSLSRYF